MKALVYEGPGKKTWKEVPRPAIVDAGDVIVKITYTTICGTDLHILKGDLPEVDPETILGHEGVGVIEEVGTEVHNFQPGDTVIISCITSCGKCHNCKERFYSHCETGGWILGHTIDGTQAEYVRIPHADNSLYRIPQGLKPEAMVMLSDILPTGFEIGVQNGRVHPGDSVAIVGSGPVGLAALMTAQLYTPAKIIMIDQDDNRLQVAKKFGATEILNPTRYNLVDKVMQVNHGRKCDVAIEAVGLPATFNIAQNIIGPRGRLACVGVFGKSVELSLERLWIENITLRTGLVNANTTEMLLKMVASDKLHPELLITHSLMAEQFLEAYDIFSEAAKYKALKVIINFN